MVALKLKSNLSWSARSAWKNKGSVPMAPPMAPMAELGDSLSVFTSLANQSQRYMRQREEEA
jgi:hypothetical protein